MQATLAEVAKARPIRGNGAPVRAASHKSAILALLQARGANGVLGSELYGQPHLYGRSPRNRISEFRKAGHLIEGKPHGSADWFYCLLRDASGAKPSADVPTPHSIEKVEIECMRRRREEQATAMPLFAEPSQVGG